MGLITVALTLVLIQVIHAVPCTTDDLSIIPDTNLLTGVNYRIDSPDYNFGILTYAEISTANGGKAIQLDDHVERVTSYAKGGKWHNDGLWNFEKSNETGYYKIVNGGVDSGKGLLAAVLQPEVLKHESAAGYPKASYLTVIKRSTYVDQDLTLWRITPAKQHDQYFLINKKLPGVVIETPRYGDFYKFFTIGSHGSSCRATDPALKFTAVSFV